MKRILLLISVAYSVNFLAQAQELKIQSVETASFPAVSSLVAPEENSPSLKPASAVNDTLEYFFLKHFFRNSTTANANLNFPTVSSPYPTTLAVSHCGAVFLNSSPISVTGLTGLVNRRVTSINPAVTFKLYLCNMNMVTNMPLFPPLDSVVASVTSTAGVWSGGTFTAPVTVNGNFAVLFKSAAPAGDTIGMFLTNANTPTSTVAQAQRFGEGLGRLRFNGVFQSLTNTFGTGTDYEFVVAPYVSYNYTSAVTVVTPTICNLTQGSFLNASTPMNLIESRFFNFNKFKPYWTPFNNLMPTLTDSIYNWTFTGSSTPPSTSKNATAVFNTLGNQSANLNVRLTITSNINVDMQDIGVGTINVNNGAAPNLTVTGDNKYCSNSFITTTLYVTGSNTYTWSSPTSVSPSIVVTTSSTVVYTVMSSSSGCTAVKIVTVTVNPFPNVLLTASAESACAVSAGGNTITLSGTPAGGFFSGTNVAGNKFTPTISGTFAPVYSYTNAVTGCSNSATTMITVLKCTSIKTNSQLAATSVFPNPAVNGKFTVSNLSGKNKVEVYNLLGSLMLEKNCEISECAIEINDLAQGHYIIKIIDENGFSKTVKIVNQH